MNSRMPAHVIIMSAVLQCCSVWPTSSLRLHLVPAPPLLLPVLLPGDQAGQEAGVRLPGQHHVAQADLAHHAQRPADVSLHVHLPVLQPRVILLSHQIWKTEKMVVEIWYLSIFSQFTPHQISNVRTQTLLWTSQILYWMNAKVAAKYLQSIVVKEAAVLVKQYSNVLWIEILLFLTIATLWNVLCWIRYCAITGAPTFTTQTTIFAW